MRGRCLLNMIYNQTELSATDTSALTGVATGLPANAVLIAVLVTARSTQTTAKVQTLQFG